MVTLRDLFLEVLKELQSFKKKTPLQPDFDFLQPGIAGNGLPQKNKSSDAGWSSAPGWSSALWAFDLPDDNDSEEPKSNFKREKK